MKTHHGLIAAVLFSAACSAPKVRSASSGRATLQAGVPVHAVLLTQLESGGTPNGSDVRLMVSDDVKDGSAATLIATGTPMSATVVWSRSEGSLGGLTNQPARLEIQFGAVATVDGQSATLGARPGTSSNFEFNRANTGRIGTSGNLEAVAADKGNDAALESIRQLFSEGSKPDLNDPATKDRLIAIAQQLQLHATEHVVKQGELDQLTSLIRQIREGSSIASVAGGGAGPTIAAALELAGLAGQAASRLGRIVKGRNITAYVGTPVVAYVTAPLVVRPVTPSP